MLISREKRREKVTDYLIHMFQAEDLIRALNRDLVQIESKIIAPYNLTESKHHEMVDWYANLVLMMEKEQKTGKGHLQFIINLINEVNEFHFRLVDSGTDTSYTEIYRTVAGLIRELRHKGATGESDVEIALTALYGFVLMNLKDQTISEETRQAMRMISLWLDKLSEMFRLYESGDLEL